MNAVTSSSEILPSPPQTRRRFLKVSSGVIAGLLSLGAHTHHNANNPLFVQTDVSSPDLPPQLDGTDLLFITDIHIGGNVNHLVHDISAGIAGLLQNSHSGSTLILHGGDFVSAKTRFSDPTTQREFDQFIPLIFRHFQGLPQIGVQGNHDEAHPDVEKIMGSLRDQFGIHFLYAPDKPDIFDFQGAKIAVHGIHTLTSRLKFLLPPVRNELLDEYIRQLNSGTQALNIVLLHNPDGLEYLLRRLYETGQRIDKKTLLFAGHTHGAMINHGWFKNIGLGLCQTEFERYQGWYGPEGIYSQTGDWQLYVGSGLGNSPYRSFRSGEGTQPRVDLFTLRKN